MFSAPRPLSGGGAAEGNQENGNMLKNIDYFGGCPLCGNSDGYLNVERNHFGVCRLHRIYWCIGVALFSSWRVESEEIWEENSRTILAYREAEPIRSTLEWYASRVGLRWIVVGIRQGWQRRRTWASLRKAA